MELGELLTNVLSFSNFSSINYEYYELQSSAQAPNRNIIHNLEGVWRKESKLAIRDLMRDGLWRFPIASQKSEALLDPTDASSSVATAQKYGFEQKDSGTYEPASLLRSKQIVPNLVSTPSTTSSPSSSMENHFRNAQAHNARSTQLNMSLPTEESTTPGSRLAVGTSSRASPKDIHEHFISAVLESIVYALCQDRSFLALSSRTILLNDQQRQTLDRHSEIVTLDVHLTSLGTLIVKAHSSMVPLLRAFSTFPSSAQNTAQLRRNDTLWLAPGGVVARFYSYSDSNGLPTISGHHDNQESSPDDQISHGFLDVTIKFWQQLCLEWLSIKGLGTTGIEPDDWIFVRIVGGSSTLGAAFRNMSPSNDWAVVPWPASLCFRCNATKSGEDTSLKDQSDPLSFAEDWFTSNDERARLISTRAKERQAAEAISNHQPEAEVRFNQSHVYPSASLRRGSNAGAIYPTPPDAPHHAVGVTPSFDGNGSTPGNIITSNPNEVGNHILSKSIGIDNDTDIWTTPGGKERSSSGPNLNENGNEHDNLFGDLAGDLFGNDVTDADFSFFDEPDAIQMDEKGSSVIPEAQATYHDLPTWDGENIQDTQISHGSMVEASSPSLEPSKYLEIPQIPVPSVVAQLKSTEDPALDDIVVCDTQKEDIDPSLVPDEFDKDIVFSKLRNESTSQASSSMMRRASLFEGIHFQNFMNSVNEKYGKNGRFSFPTRQSKSDDLTSTTLPQTQYLEQWQKAHKEGSEMNTLGRILPYNDLNQLRDEHDVDSTTGNSNNSSPVSERNGINSTSCENPSIPTSRNKRKWKEHESIETSLSAIPYATDKEIALAQPPSLSYYELNLLNPCPADWSPAPYFVSCNIGPYASTLSDLERITIAQILADQAVSSTLDFGTLPTIHNAPLEEVSIIRRLLNRLMSTTELNLDEGQLCTLRNYIDIAGIPAVNQSLRLPPRPNPAPKGLNAVDSSKSVSPYSIPPPQLEVRRSESKLSVLPAAIRFWENLGLGPSQGSKDITAVCVYPNLDGVAENADIFLDQMRSAYESSRLGVHDSTGLQTRLTPFDVNYTQPDSTSRLAALKEITGRLSRTFIFAPDDRKNFVVYFIYPEGDDTIIVHICSAFHHLFNTYKKLLSERRLPPTNELVLQLIPLKFVAPSSSLAVPLPSEYFDLAMQVYDRCTNFGIAASTPAIVLEQPLPKTIDFKLNGTPSASVLHENTCLHVAYAQSIDGRWITAAWSDNRGTQQMTASYCLGRRNEPISMPFSDVANEIWETTLELISSKKVHWRIMIARVGVMDPVETDFWISLASTESNAHLSLTLVTVQTDPSLRLLPPPSSILLNGSSTQPVITPVSTPQPSQVSILSPETATPPGRENPSAATPTPAAEATAEPDTDARLFESSDASWGAVLSHRLNNSNSLLDVNPALISGYLIKRGGTNPEDPSVLMEVNIIHSEVVGNPRTFHESLLREILRYYRGLGTLARVRGMVDKVRDVRPWHVAAAEKAVKALYMLM